MMLHQKIEGVLLAEYAAALFSMPSYEDSLCRTPQPIHERDVMYVTGGTGIGQTEALRACAKNFNLEITSGDRAGHFAENGTDLTIKGKGGYEVLSVEEAGPLFYARLPMGTYVIDARNAGQRRVQIVNIIPNKLTDVHLVWEDE